ncbi:MAG: carboxylesterase family protein [Deltaproteobacteria bacterium]|nr:carboxylesterase family protein [Deltaproteobacteria bacterium]
MKYPKKIFPVLFALLLLTGCGDNDGNTTFESKVPTVETRSGSVSGIIDNDSYAYLGLPFAKPPVGDLRWRLPETESPWTGVYQADSLSPACPQDLGQTNIYGLTSCDEDCLYLNVWTPTDTKGGSLPVMLWLHGGGYMGGSASQDLYNGTALTQKGVIVVTANYRLGPLGFLVHPELYQQQGQAGNYGLYDQLAALEWVRENVSAFGGDPDNITIFGNSSGACSVTLFQTAPITRGLFQRAISQSGTASSTWYVLNLTGSWWEAEAYGLWLQETLGAADIEEMRRMGAEDIAEAAYTAKIYFGPVMDGVFLSQDPRQSALDAVHAPMMIGSNRDEGTLFIWEYGIETLSDYRLALTRWFGENAESVWELWPGSTDEEAMWQAATVLGLAGMQEPVRHTARGASLSVPVYRYYYTHVPPTEAGAGLGCFHGSELAYVFGNLDPGEGYGAEDAELSNQIMDLWTSFAKTGVPETAGAPRWPQYSTGQESILSINGPGDINLIDGLAEEECDFFESIAPNVTPDYPQ